MIIHYFATYLLEIGYLPFVVWQAIGNTCHVSNVRRGHFGRNASFKAVVKILRRQWISVRPLQIFSQKESIGLTILAYLPTFGGSWHHIQRLEVEYDKPLKQIPHNLHLWNPGHDVWIQRLRLRSVGDKELLVLDSPINNTLARATGGKQKTG
jgi:hypothetical protein